MEKERPFNQKVTDSIDRAFDSLGDSVALALYLSLEKDFSISKEDVPSKPEELSQVLKKVFGPSGRDFMIKLISDEIIREFDLDEQILKGKSIPELLKAARETYQLDSESS